MQQPFAEIAAEPTDRLGFDIMAPFDAAMTIGGIVRDLSVELGAADRPLWGRPLAPERLHVRLAHLGDYAGLPKSLVADAAAAAQEVKFCPFEVTFDRIGSFGGRQRNLPLALQGGDGLAALKDMTSALHMAMRAHKLGKWAKSYTPHLTVLYDNQLVAERPTPPIVWRVDRFQLTHGLLGKGKSGAIGQWTAT